MKKTISVILSAIMLCFALGSCAAQSFDKANAITVITRESGSGTRGAFIELFGIEQKNSEGKKVDLTTATAITNDKTGIVLTTVAQDINAIGYISLGSLNDTVKALKIDGADASVANVKNGTYKVARPFNIATKDGLSAVAQDFIAFIMSSDGQSVIEANGYIQASAGTAYSGTKPSGTIKISGSSSVTPVMEKLKEAYLALNGNAKIEINMTDSTSGVSDAAEGISDIGMASREIKDSELASGVTGTTIATDGIAVIVNKDNPLSGLTTDNVRAIYMGEAVKWQDI